MAYRNLTDRELHDVERIIREGEQARRKLYDRLIALHGDGVPSQELADLMGVSRATFYRLMLEMGAPQ